MQFPYQQFTLRTKVGEGSPEVNTVVTIEAGFVDEAVVVSSSTSGNSPRVSKQAAWRKAGKIPATANYTWAEWFGRIKTVNQPETPESIKERAKSDPVFKAQMLEMMAALSAE